MSEEQTEGKAPRFVHAASREIRNEADAAEWELDLRARNGDHRGYALSLRNVAERRQAALLSFCSRILEAYSEAIDDMEELKSAKKVAARHSERICGYYDGLAALKHAYPKPREDKPW